MSQRRRASTQAIRRGKAADGSFRRQRRAPWRALGLALLLGVAGMAWWLLGARATGVPAARPTAAAIGGVTACRGIPRFSERLGYQGRAGISTSERTRVGLVLFDARVPLNADLARRDLHQEPSWDDAGTLGPLVFDRQGNIYTAPVPRAAASDNPPGSQNTIYRVDSDSGELRPYLTLPGAAPTSAQNPFGILGLAYDCDSDALYVSTTAGSTLHVERGRIVRVDLATGTTSEEVAGVDVIGLGVFRGVGGKRLYLGLAREGALASVALDGDGHATGELRSELSVLDQAAGMGEPRVRRVSFEGETMLLYIVPFNFNLRAVSEQQQVVARYRYDAARDGWVADVAAGMGRR